MYRIPLNMFVVLLLLKIKLLSSQYVFLICATAHLISFVCYAYFYMTSKEGMQVIHNMQELPTLSPSTSNVNNNGEYQRVSAEVV